MSLYTSELHAKRVELLDEFVPGGAPVEMIVNPNMPHTEPLQGAGAAARAKGHPLVVVRVSAPRRSRRYAESVSDVPARSV